MDEPKPPEKQKFPEMTPEEYMKIMEESISRVFRNMPESTEVKKLFIQTAFNFAENILSKKGKMEEKMQEVTAVITMIKQAVFKSDKQNPFEDLNQAMYAMMAMKNAEKNAKK